jgi:uncharacterized membrane protein YgcG
VARRNKHPGTTGGGDAPVGAAHDAETSKPFAERLRDAPPGSPLVRRIRFGALGVLVVILALIFAVPREAEPPASLDQPNEAFLDKAGIVSRDYARTMAGVLLRDPRYQMVVYVDARPPEGDLSAWASEAATRWRVGERSDNGIALFVFPEARIARAEVGYGLEGALPDAFVRRLLEDRLAPRFAVRDYEGGFDAFIKGIGDALGGDAAMHALWLESGGRPGKSTSRMMLDTARDGIERAPRMLRATWRAYVQGNATERFFVLLCSAIFLAILAATIGVGGTTIAQALTLARSLAGARAGGSRTPADGRPLPAAGAAPTGKLAQSRIAQAGFVVFGVVVFCMFSLMLLFALSLAEDALHRKGDFSGAGAYVSWPAPG